MNDAVASPCVNVCRMDADNLLCLGCLRTLNEIAQWSRASDEEKHATLAAVALRRDAQVSTDASFHPEDQR